MLEKIGHWLQIVSGLVLIVGVVLVVEQLRQAERLTQTQIAATAITQRATLATMLAGEAPMAAWARLCDPEVDLSREDALIIHNVLLGRMLMAVNYVAVQEYGEFEDGEDTRLRTIAGNLGLVLSTPQGRAWFDALPLGEEYRRAAELSRFADADCETPDGPVATLLEADRREKARMRADARAEARSREDLQTP